MDITVDPDTIKLVFPDTAQGSIKPGSLDHLTKLEVIIWGKNMTGLIEPDTIPDDCWLVLRESYKHLVDLSELKPGVRVYTHALNYSTAPTDRCFRLWGMKVSQFIVGSVQCMVDHDHTNLSSSDMNAELCTKGEFIHTCAVTKVPVVLKSEAVSEPVPEESIEETQTRINEELLELSQKGDLATISAFIDANQTYLRIRYRDFAVLRTFIERHDLDLCKLICSKLGTIGASHLQRWIKQGIRRDERAGDRRADDTESVITLEGVRTSTFSFLLDLAEALEIKPIVSLAKYCTFLYNVCCSDADLEVCKRVYGLWPTPDPFRGFGGSCYSWNNEKIDYFLPLCKKYASPSNGQKTTALMNAVYSGNLYAFRGLASNLDIDWRSTMGARPKGQSENTLVAIIRSSVREETGTLTRELIEYLSRPAYGFTRANIDACANSDFWSQYTEAVEMVCESGRTDAIRFFMARSLSGQPKVDIVRTASFIKAASSEDAVKAIIETAAHTLALEATLDLAKSIESPFARKHIASYYKSLASQLEAQQ